ncbi:MAG: hypothetical protein WDO13_21430 [Verrucomicrobiota bacterium]
MQQLRFFLSATSEAPEVNLFGQPRISIWPINSDFDLLRNPNSSYVTTTDKLIATAATLINSGTAYPYYFTRGNSQSGTADYTNIPRNQNIYSCLRTLAATSIPGYGGTFNGKYSRAEMDQILTEIFDYIRCTDPTDPLLAGDSTQVPPLPGYQYARTSNRSLGVGPAGWYWPWWTENTGLSIGQGQVLPHQHYSFGRILHDQGVRPLLQHQRHLDRFHAEPKRLRGRADDRESRGADRQQQHHHHRRDLSRALLSLAGAARPDPRHARPDRWPGCHDHHDHAPARIP